VTVAAYDTSALLSNPLPDGLVRVELDQEPEVLYDGDAPSRVRPGVRDLGRRFYLNGRPVGELLHITECRDLTKPHTKTWWEVVYRPEPRA
jgi:hypothetical protein